MQSFNNSFLSLFKHHLCIGHIDNQDDFQYQWQKDVYFIYLNIFFLSAFF